VMAVPSPERRPAGGTTDRIAGYGARPMPRYAVTMRVSSSAKRAPSMSA
jgi:hypothetical protein